MNFEKEIIMEKIRKSSNIAANVAKVLRTFCLIGLIFSVLGAVCGFALNGYVNQYYQSEENLLAAQSSLDADMGIFSLLPFDSLKASGNYGIFFAVQLLCLIVILIAHMYLFSVLKKAMENIRDTGRAYAAEDAAKTKKSFIIVTILIVLFGELSEAIVVGILLCGLYNVTAARDLPAE